MLRIHEVSAKKDNGQIIKKISIELKPGERILLMGPNGSGKTSLSRVLMGDPLYKVTSGKIELVDEKETIDVLQLSPQERARRGIFISFQNPVPIPGVNAYEFLYAAHREIYPEVSKKMEVSEFEKLLEDAADTLGVGMELLGRAVNEGFSGGERKKLELVQMLVLRPKYVVLDEPDSGLDADTVKLVKKAVDALGNKSSVLVISHDPSRLGMKKFDQVCIMKEGAISEKGGTDLIAKVAKGGYGKE